MERSTLSRGWLASLMCLMVFGLVTARPVYGGTLTAEEIQQIESEFGITLTAAEKSELAAVVKPDAPYAQWRIDANARIYTNRMADLTVQVQDSEGTPMTGVSIAVKQNRNAFKFAGTFSAKDHSGATLPATMTTATYKQRLLSMFNAVGLNNGFKPRLTGIHTYLPGVLSWAFSNNMPVRGHLLIWPGTGDVAAMDAPEAVPVDDYGHHLSQASTSAYASYDVLGAVETYKASARTQADKDALKAVVDSEILEWVSQWDVYEWDVINETLGNRLLMDILGDQEMAEWFKIASSNKVSGNCKLLINDYQIISCMSESRTPGYYTGRRNTYMANIDRILADGGPLDGIGFQSRIKHERRDPQLIYDRLEEWGNRYGLQMVGTEFEVIDSEPGAWKEYIYTDAERAQITEEMMMQYYSHPLVSCLTAWHTINNDVEALIDYNGRPNVNGLVWYYLHRIRYTTDLDAQTDGTGEASARGHKGDYDLVVTYDGTNYPFTANLASNTTVLLSLDGVVFDSVGDPPVASNDSFTVIENQATILDVLANDVDPERQPISVNWLGGPGNGSVSNNGDGTVTYTGNPGYTGADSFNYRITDGSLTSGVATVSLTVNPDVTNYTLTVYATNGVVTKNPDLAEYPQGTNVDLTAVPDPNYEFTGWSGDASGTNNPLTVTMDGPKSITAVFTYLGPAGDAEIDYQDSLVPPGLQAGDTFHLVFVTSPADTIDSTWDLTQLNAHVNDIANDGGGYSGSHVARLGLTWYAIASDTTTDACSNAVVSAPVYMINGDLIATGYSDMWDGSIATNLAVTEQDTTYSGVVRTGSNADGTAGGNPFGVGGGQIDRGLSSAADANWIQGGNEGDGVRRRAYVLSERITVVAVTTNHSVPYAWLASQNATWTNDYEAAVTNDADDDGFTTAEEYWSGTDPMNSNSFLKIDGIELSSTNFRLIWAHTNVDLGIPAIAIQGRASMATGSWEYVSGHSPSNGVNFRDVLGQPVCFYRLCVTNMP